MEHWIRALPSIAILTITAAVNHFADIRRPHPLALPLNAIDEQLAGWRLIAKHSPDLRAESRLRASEYLSRTYEQGGQRLDLLIVFYADQRAGESMHSPKACLPGAGWLIWPHPALTLLVDRRPIQINYYSAQRATKRRAVLYWYQERDRILTNEYAAKLSLFRTALSTGSAAGALVRIVVQDEAATVTAATRLAIGVITELQRCYGTKLKMAGAPSGILRLK